MLEGVEPEGEQDVIEFHGVRGKLSYDQDAMSVTATFHHVPRRPTAPGQGGLSKPASFGGVVVGDGVEIGPNAVIEEGESRPTMIADGVRIGALACIAHDCSIGPGTELVGMVGLAGGVQIGAETLLMGQVGVSSGARIGDRAVVFGQSGVIGRVPDDGRYMGYPAWPRDQWLRAQARLRRGSRPRPAPRPGT